MNFDAQAKDQIDLALTFEEDDWDVDTNDADQRKQSEAQAQLEAYRGLDGDVYRSLADVDSLAPSEFGSFPAPRSSGVSFKPSAAGFGGSHGSRGKLGWEMPATVQKSLEQLDLQTQMSSRTTESDESTDLESLPPYYERYSSYEVPVHGKEYLQEAKKHKDELVAGLNKISDVRVQFQAHASQFTIEGVSYHRQDSSKWKIQIFQDTDRNNLLVEFQRRSGSAFVFRRFYESLRGLLDEAVKAPIVRFSDLPGLDDQSVDAKEMDQDIMKSLVEWARSSYLDQRREGMRLLLSLMEDPDSLAHTTKSVGESELISVFVESINCDDVETRRLAALGLFRCSQNEELLQKIAGNFDAILQSLQPVPSIDEVDGHHHMLRCIIALLGGKKGHEIRKQYEKEFGRLFAINAPQLADDISSLKSLLPEMLVA